jgi:DNA-binding SARP family transcriptional activator/ABC-type transport system substrate-binding protein
MLRLCCCRDVEIRLQKCLGHRVEFGLLGPLEVQRDGRLLALGGPKQRALLALLLLNANEVVSRDRLIDALWGERPPATAQRSLDSYVSRLRTLLGPDRIERRAPGYTIRVSPDELDLRRFEALFERGRVAAASGDAAEASLILGEALALWRGHALADLEHDHSLGVEAERLEERRLLALERRIDAEIELGRGSELVGELERLVAEQPFRERLIGQLMLSLYRAGRQADALAAYQACRRRFAEELGLEPGAELRVLERRVLEHDPALGPAMASRSVARSRITPGRVVTAALVLAAVAASLVAGIELGTGGGGSSATALGSMAGVFELGTGSLVADLSPHAAPAAMAADPQSIWLAEPDAGTVVRVDRVSRQVVERIPVGGVPSALTVGGGAVWVASVPGTEVDRIDPATYTVTRPIRLGSAQASALAFGLGHLWVADSTDESLLEFDPLTGTLHRALPLDLDPTALAIGAGAIWVAGDGDFNEGLLERIDPHSGRGIPIHVGDGPVAVAVGGGAVWVANRLDSSVSKVDPASDTPVGATPVGSYPAGLTVNGASVWVANEYSSTVSRIDARSGRVTGTTPVGGAPTALVSAAGRVWVGTRSLGAHRGGTLVLLHTRPLSLDPALQVDLPPLQSNGLTYDALLTNPHIGGAQALHFFPDLAVSVPVPTNQGMTYTFRLRPGIRYSDGRLVRTGDFRRAIERLFRVEYEWSGNYRSIIGANACTARRCDLARGIATDDGARTITFHLRTPDPGFLQNMTSMATAPVPPGTPFRDTSASPIPGTGPYVVASANEHEVRYVRNPRFREWSHAAQPDGNPDVIVMRYGLTQAQEAREVEDGKADWTADGVPAALQREVMTRFPAQLHQLQAAETDFLRLNTTQPPFNDLRVRRALNLAIDRAAIVHMYGPAVATPTCQVLPPSSLGYRRYCPYTRTPRADGRWTAPDLARARRLVAASGTRGEQITVWGASDGPVHESTVVPYTVSVLRRLGYRARARLVPSSYFDHHPRVPPKIQLIPNGLANGSTFEFFTNACSARANHRWFCDPRVDRTIREANTLEARNPRAAGILWARIDREFVDRAAWVPLVNSRWIDFVSARVHNYEADPSLGLIADQVSLR